MRRKPASLRSCRTGCAHRRRRGRSPRSSGRLRPTGPVRSACPRACSEHDSQLIAEHRQYGDRGLRPDDRHVYLTTKVNDGPDVPSQLVPPRGRRRHRCGAGRLAGEDRRHAVHDPAHPFQPRRQPAARRVLLGGVVYMAFGSQCDYGTYVGWVAGVNHTHQVNVWSDEVGATSRGAGIWQAGGGLVSDGPGRIFLATGNGVTAPDGPGNAPPPQLSESVVRLGVTAMARSPRRTSSAQPTPPSSTATTRTSARAGRSRCPSSTSARRSPHLMVQIGKDGRLFLLDRDHLGGKDQGRGATTCCRCSARTRASGVIPRCSAATAATCTSCRTGDDAGLQVRGGRLGPADAEPRRRHGRASATRPGRQS